MLQKPKTYIYLVYITLPLQGQHRHLASRSIHMDHVCIPRPDASPDTEVLSGRRSTIMMMMRVKIDVYICKLGEYSRRLLPEEPHSSLVTTTLFSVMILNNNTTMSTIYSS